MTKRRRGYYTYSFYYVDHDSFLCPEQHVPALGSASAFQREARKGMARPSLCPNCLWTQIHFTLQMYELITS